MSQQDSKEEIIKLAEELGKASPSEAAKISVEIRESVKQLPKVENEE